MKLDSMCIALMRAGCGKVLKEFALMSPKISIQQTDLNMNSKKILLIVSRTAHP